MIILKNKQEVLDIIKGKKVLDLTGIFIFSNNNFLEDFEVAVTYVDYVSLEPFSFLVVVENDLIQKAIILPQIYIGVYDDKKVYRSPDEIISRNKEILIDKEFVFISGESLTADIEKELISGVHGPAKVYAYKID